MKFPLYVLLLCLPLNVMGYDPLPNGDASYIGPGTGLRKVVYDWIAGGSAKDDVVAKYGEIENWGTSEVTNLAYVFYDQSTFNADISKWVVSSVTNLLGSRSFLANCLIVVLDVLFGPFHFSPCASSSSS